MNAADMILTRGQQLVDKLVGESVRLHFGRSTFAKQQRCADELRRYIEAMDGNGNKLVRTLIQTMRRSFARTSDMHRLKQSGAARVALEAYVEEREIATGKRKSIIDHSHKMGNHHRPPPHGRYESQGWGVAKNRAGNWRIELTSVEDGRPHHVTGTYDTRDEARTAAREMIARMRGGT